MTYEGGTGSTQVAHFEYDALGRLISSQLRFDADENAMTETLKYYYDGSNVAAEYDPSDNLSRRYIHGTNRVDERAVLLEGEGDELDTFYYMLQELDTVTGLVTKNGTLAEAYTYDAYGRVSPWGYRYYDFDRDGENLCSPEFGDAYPSSPASDPMADGDMDGDVDYGDSLLCPWPPPVEVGVPITLHTSGIGNPYFFTGRRLHFLETLHDNPDPEDPEPNWQVQYNRNRHYCPIHGRWLQRDPSGYTDGMNLYEYVRSQPTVMGDPSGMWGRSMHYQGTYDAAIQVGMKAKCARILASWNQGVDNVTSAIFFPWFHFNYKYNLFSDTSSAFGCGRDCWGSKRWSEGTRRLRNAGNWGKVKRGLWKIGESLHSYQDGFTHRQGGGRSTVDGKTHWAPTWFAHAPAEACLLAGDPFGIIYEGCKRAKRDNPNWGNLGRTDDEVQFLDDFTRTGNDTKSRLRSLMSIKSMRCNCKE